MFEVVLHCLKAQIAVTKEKCKICSHFLHLVHILRIVHILRMANIKKTKISLFSKNTDENNLVSLYNNANLLFM